MSCLFVTGTDTGVGKTYVTAALARRARNQGQKVFAFKPIETGCAPGQLGDDQRILCEAAGGWQQGALCGLYQFEMAVAPLVAASQVGSRIDLARVVELVRTGSESAELTLVEGAGGWRVPITEDEDMADLARRVGGQVVLVARAGLGTINHSLLSIEAVERDGCRVVALVLSQRPTDDAWLADSNRQEISRRWPGRVETLETLLRSTWNYR